MASRSLVRLRRAAFAGALLFSAPTLATMPACAAHGPDLFARIATAKQEAEFNGYKSPLPALNDRVDEGKETKLKLDLKEACYQIYVFAGDGVRELDATVVDAGGKSVGDRLKQEGRVVIKACPTEAGEYFLSVKSTSGSGGFMAQAYSKDEKKDPSDPNCVGPDCSDPDPRPGDGPDPEDCSAGIDLPMGATVKGTVGRSRNGVGSGRPTRWTCAASEGSYVVYRLHVEGRHKLALDMNAKFDGVLALFRSTSEGYLCEEGTELECSDDAEGSTSKSHVEALVDTGDYGVVVSSFDGDRGEFELRAQQFEAPGLDTYCNAARPVSTDVKMSDSLGGVGSNFRASCGTGEGDELLYKLDVKQRSRVRATARANGGGDGGLSVSIRSRCEDPMSELQCSTTYRFDGISWTGLMPPGNYTLMVDAGDPSFNGMADVQVDVAPDGGTGQVESDSCKDPKPFVTTGTTLYDTFKAKGDARVSCANDAGPDLVYKLDVKNKTRFFFSVPDLEGRHVLAIQKACSDLKGEISCDQLSSGKTFDQTLDPGSYYVILKGKGPDDFGRTRLFVKARDLGGAAAVCKAAPKIEPGKPISDTTAAATDNFASPGCGGQINSQSSGDKTYTFTLKERSHVSFSLKSSNYYALMSLRSDCADPTRSEIVCSNYYTKFLERDLDPGTYYIVVDGWGSKAEGPFTIEMNAKKL